MSSPNPHHPPLDVALGLVQAVVDADALIDLDDAMVHTLSQQGPWFWLMTLRDDVVSCSIKIAVSGGLRTQDVAVWPLGQAPQPWGDALRRAIQEHQLRRDVLVGALDAALPAEAAGWLPAAVEC